MVPAGQVKFAPSELGVDAAAVLGLGGWRTLNDLEVARVPALDGR